MGYKQRGLSLAALRREADRILAENISGREAAIICCENNYRLLETEIQKRPFLSDKERETIYERAREAAPQVLNEFALYMEYGRRFYDLVQEMSIKKNRFRAQAVIVIEKLNELQIAKAVCTLLAHYRKTKGAEELSDDMEWLRRSLLYSGIYAEENKNGTFSMSGEYFYALNLEANRLKFRFKEYAVYCKAVDVFLKDEKLAPFVPDQLIVLTELLNFSFVPETVPNEKEISLKLSEIDKLRKEHRAIFEEVEKTEKLLNAAKKDKTPFSKEQLSEAEKTLEIQKLKLSHLKVLISQTEADIVLLRNFSIFPKKEEILSSITEKDVSNITNRIYKGTE